MIDLERDEIVVFASELGWISLKMQGDTVRQLSFGHATADVAVKAIGPGRVARGRLRDSQRKAVKLLQQYALGEAVDFGDINIDSGAVSEFQTRVLKACREIPYGQTITYGALAQAAGRPGAARAVGSCMSSNRLPLIIPCHRVVRVGGDIGPYSAAGGTATKRRLLEMEAAKVAGTLRVQSALRSRPHAIVV